MFVVLNAFSSLFQLAARHLESLACSNFSRAIREGLLWVVPTLLLSDLFLFLATAGTYLDAPEKLVDILLSAHRGLAAICPLLIAAAIAYFLALQYHLPRLPVAFLCLSQVLLSTLMFSGNAQVISVVGIGVALFTPMLMVPFLAYLVRNGWLPAMRMGLVNDNLREMLNMLLPGVVCTALFLLLMHVVREALIWLLDYPTDFFVQGSPYLSGLLVAALNSVLWFFGIHGYHALAPVFQSLDQAVLQNALDLAQGGVAGRILNSSQLASFVFIGGAGATFSLALCLAIFCRNQTLRLLGMASLPLAFMNVNEVLLFGLPIILNPRLLVPFLIAPMCNLVLSLGAISLGLVSPATVQLPMTAPMLFNAYWASGGEFSAVLLQLVLLAISVCIYLPFVKALERRGSGNEVIEVPSLETTFTRLHEEASLYSYDLVNQASSLRRRHAEENQHIRQIAEYEFFLEFQPQVSLRTGTCMACEALLRARAPSGKVQAPAEFLQWLERAGLSGDLNLWVAQAAVAQYYSWQEAGFSACISINVTGCTLGNPEYSRRLVEILTPVGQGFVVEITEGALLGAEDGAKNCLSELRRIGVQIAIDDFGTGYSALSYLHQFNIDKIKIDRSFVLASALPRGQAVLDGLLAFSERLGLSIVVEGVETEEQRACLTARGDLLIQGWLYSRALSAVDYVNFAESTGARV